MSVDKVNGKQVLINEINRLNGIEVEEEAIDLIFDNFKDKETNTVSSDKLKEHLCTIYSLDENDKELLGYIENIAKADGADGISLNDLNSEYEYNQTSNPTKLETREEKKYETGLQSIERFLGYQGIKATSEDIEKAFNECPADKDFATYLKEKYKGNYDVKELNKILQQISTYKETNATMTREDLTTASTVEGEEMTGAQLIANSINKRLHDETSISADYIIGLYDEYAAQNKELSNEAFTKYILNKCSLKEYNESFIKENIDLAAKFNSPLELADLKASGEMIISYQAEVPIEKNDASTNSNETSNSQQTNQNSATQQTQQEPNVTTTVQNPNSKIEGTTVTLENNIVTSVNLSNGKVIDITDDNADASLKIKNTVDANGVLQSKIIESNEDTVYVYYKDGSVSSIYLNDLTEAGNIYTVKQENSTTVVNDNSSSNTQASQETTQEQNNNYAPMTPPQAAQTITSTMATSSKARNAVVGLNSNGTVTSVTLPNYNNLTFDLTDELIKGVTGEQNHNTTTYNIEDKGVTVKDIVSNGIKTERQIIAPDGTTLYVYYKEGVVSSLWLDDVSNKSNNIYASAIASGSSSASSASNSSNNINANVDTLIEDITNSLGNPFDGEVEETTDENGNKVSTQQYESGSIATTYDAQGNETFKTIKDKDGNITATVEYGESTIVTQYTGKDNQGNNNYIQTTKDNLGNTTTEIKDFNILVKSNANNELSITIDGKEYNKNIVKESDTKYSYTVNGNTYFFVRGNNGNWSIVNSDNKEATPEKEIMTSFFERLSSDEQIQVMNKANEFMANGSVKKQAIAGFLKEDGEPFAKMAVLEVLSEEGYGDVIKSAMANNDWFFKDGVEYMMDRTRNGEYSIQDIIDFENRYVEMNRTDDLWDGATLYKTHILDLYLDIYKLAQNTDCGGSQEAVENASESLLFSVPKLAKEIQMKFKKDEETEKLGNLLEYAGFSEENINNINVPSNSNELKENYLDGNEKENLLAILKDCQSNNLELEETYYLLAQEYNDADDLIDVFRSLKKDEQEKYIEILYEAVAYQST